MDGALVDMARRRRAENTAVVTVYALSMLSAFGLSTAHSALVALPGYEDIALWLGRFAALPGLTAALAMGVLLRHQWRARGYIEHAFKPPISRWEPLAVSSLTLAVSFGGWLLRPGINPTNLGLALLVFSLPLLWTGVRSPSSARWVFFGLGVALGVVGALFLGLRVVYGPLVSATGPALVVLIAAQVGLASLLLVGLVPFIVVVGVGFLRAERAFDRGDLQTLSTFSYLGLLEDNPRVLDALRRLGRHEEMERRFRGVVSSVPFAGPLHVLAESLLDRGDPRAAEVAWQAVLAAPEHQGSLLAAARAHRVTDPNRTLDAVEMFGRTLVGNDREPVFRALEAGALARLGRNSTARAVLDDLEVGEHPVYAPEARGFAAEAEALLAG